MLPQLMVSRLVQVQGKAQEVEMVSVLWLLAEEGVEIEVRKLLRVLIEIPAVSSTTTCRAFTQ